MSEVLRLENVSKSFGRRPVVKNVSSRSKKGRFFGFLGPNGAGKTTTIKMVLGLLAADSGTILVNGHDIEKEFEAAMTGISGIVENPDMYGYLSGYDNLVLQARACGADPRRIDEVVTLVGMQMRIKEKFKSYSLGMKQRLGVAQALLHNPKIMILDEPTNGLDPAGIKEFRDLLRHLAHQQGLSVMVSSHILPGNAAHVRQRRHHQQRANCSGWARSKNWIPSEHRAAYTGTVCGQWKTPSACAAASRRPSDGDRAGLHRSAHHRR